LVVLGNGKETFAWFALQSKERKGMQEAIKKLKQMGIASVLLTGDRFEAAQEIAEPLGIEEVWAAHSPLQKAEKVREAKAQGHWVLMVGDGINDAEALSEAQMSIAMQEGSGLAVSSAGMRLPAAQLPQLPKLIELGKKTRQTIRQNLAWAFLYNVLALPIAAGALYPITGYLMDPMWAGLAMALSSVSVVANSIRLRLKFRNFEKK
jgi:P-type Cu2+ transporter